MTVLLIALGAALAVGGLGTLLVLRRVPRKSEERGEAESIPASAQPEPVSPTIAAPTSEIRTEKPDLSEKLARTRGSLVSRLSEFLSRSSISAVSASEWEGLEEALLQGDVGTKTTQVLLDRLRENVGAGTQTEMRGAVLRESERLLEGLSHGFGGGSEWPHPLVISVVGVNGAGKTTTIGKLAHRFTKDGKTVLLGAGDTFRAAAIGQLKVWADRVGTQFVTGREGADPGAVAFDSVMAGKSRGIDVVILDTAGRLHTKTNLMDELKKIHRVVKKVIPEAPHETWLVLDGTTGQNAVQQAREFQKALDLTGVIVTKLDGTAKGGAILSIASELRLPIKFIGLGESVEDLIPFEPRPFVEAILGAQG